MTRACLLLALVLLPAVVAQDAPAQSRLLDTGVLGDLAGPSFAGTSVVWARAKRSTVAAVVHDGTARRVLAGTVPDGEDFTLDADRDGIALASRVVTCEGEGAACEDDSPYGGSVATGPLGGPLVVRSSDCGATAPAVAQGAAAWSCGTPRTVVVREPDGRTHGVGLSLGDDPAMRAAGEYLAAGDGSVTVVRRSDGAEVLRRGGIGAFDLAPDGSLVFFDAAAQRVVRAAPGQAERTLFAASGVVALRIGVDRIATMSTTATRRTFNVHDAAGALIARHTEPLKPTEDGEGLDFDFDGARLAWVQRPCTEAFVAVWELHLPPPPRAGRGCTPPTTRTRVLRAGPGGFVLIPVRCPSAARAGCSGDVLVRVRGRSATGRPFRFAHRADYALRRGSAVGVRLRFSSLELRTIRRARHRSATIELSTVGRARTQRVRVTWNPAPRPRGGRASGRSSAG